MTDNLTPEAVKAALDGATPGPWDEPSIQWTVSLGFVGFNLQVRTTRKRAKHDARLIAKAPALARDWLRLKKVEEAAHRMQTAWGNSPTGVSTYDAGFAAGIEEAVDMLKKLSGKLDILACEDVLQIADDLSDLIPSNPPRDGVE
jgi:hypothetical protein